MPDSGPLHARPIRDRPAVSTTMALRERVLIIAPHSSYRSSAFLDAAKKLGVEVLFASEGRHSVVSMYSNGLHIDIEDSDGAIETILREASRFPFRAVVGTDDSTIELAARVARSLGLRHNPAPAVRIARFKDEARTRLAQTRIPVPRFRLIDLRRPLAPQAEQVRFPCVLKPLSLSASRGVIRADNPDQFLSACARIHRLLQAEAAEQRDHILAEDFIPGVEVAVEAMLTEGELEVLAIFDKPDPLDGPYFEETYYVTPSRLDPALQRQIRDRVNDACDAYGLREGPVHAECRLNHQGVWILEVAPRTIGGQCARLLQYATGQSLEELVLSHAMGRQRRHRRSRRDAAGVLMIPIPAAGILRRVEGVLAAERVPYVEEVSISVREGYQLVPWPEGSTYLGFIFSRAPTPGQAEAALREAHARLRFVVAPLWNIDTRSIDSSTASVRQYS